MAVCRSYWLCGGVMSRTACYISVDDELARALAVRANIYNVGIVDVIKFVQYAQKHNVGILDLCNMHKKHNVGIVDVIRFVQYAQKRKEVIKLDYEKLIQDIINEDTRDSAILLLQDKLKEQQDKIDALQSANEINEKRIEHLKMANSDLFMRVNATNDEQNKQDEMTVDDVLNQYFKGA